MSQAIQGLLHGDGLSRYLVVDREKEGCPDSVSVCRHLGFVFRMEGPAGRTRAEEPRWPGVGAEGEAIPREQSLQQVSIETEQIDLPTFCYQGQINHKLFFSFCPLAPLPP